MASVITKGSKESHTTSATDQKIESKLNVRDLQAIYEAFSLKGNGYDNKLRLTKEQFVEAMSLLLSRGSRQEYKDLFDKIDITSDGFVDWDKFASHLLLEFYERDDRQKTLSIPQWRDMKSIKSPHKDNIQKIVFLRNMSRYLSISREGLAALWGIDLKPHGTAKVSTESCRPRDTFVTDFVVMPNINKVAIAFTSKEIAFCNLSVKMDLFCPIKLCGITHTPLCLDHWHKPENPNDALLAWGDTGGYLNVLFWTHASMALFDKPTNLSTEKEVMYVPQLEAFITCATVWNNSMVITWLEKLPSNASIARNPNAFCEPRVVSRRSVFTVHQGINDFDFHEGNNQIATAGVNYHVCLWNPYVVSKPNGLLRGHMAAVVAVQFHISRSRLLSFSRDRVLRIWDVQLQVCLQKMNSVCPKGLSVTTHMYFHEDRLRLFLSFNHTLTVMEMRIKVHDRILSHEKPLIGIIYNSAFNQIVSAAQSGTISFWLIETGQRVKSISRSHGESELTCLVQDPTETKFYTGSTDGTIKIWDMNGYCYHTLICYGGSHAEVGQIVILKRAIIVMGNSTHFTVFRTTNFRDHYVYPSEWKGGPEHSDDVLSGTALPPNGLITGSYDGEIVVWNTNSELAARRMTARCKNFSAESPDFMYNISRLILLSTRKHIGSGSQKGANLVSCGGNGIVRFWNAYSCILVGEFLAHENASSIIMAIDINDEYLATGDVEGTVKIWNIKDYCLNEGEMEVDCAPDLIGKWSAHIDLISGLCFCSRVERRTLIATASSDCSVILWTLEGMKIGIFGQEIRWKLENIQRENALPSIASTESCPEGTSGDLIADIPAPIDSLENFLETSRKESTSPEFTVEMSGELDGEMSLEEMNKALSSFRVNAWKNTVLGKVYQEVRLSKRQRKQPVLLTELFDTHAEGASQKNQGPYYALHLSELDQITDMEQPDFMFHPENYFTDKEEIASITVNKNNPESPQPVTSHFNEESLFPDYIINFDKQMQLVNKFVNTRHSFLNLKKNKSSDNHNNAMTTWDKRQHSKSKQKYNPVHLPPIIKK
ncbi:unnamed protein product [Trichobilharzia szidati]|nr:unnamed protein product [Trichobilharzia szidati]